MDGVDRPTGEEWLRDDKARGNIDLEVEIELVVERWRRVHVIFLQHEFPPRLSIDHRRPSVTQNNVEKKMHLFTAEMGSLDGQQN